MADLATVQRAIERARAAGDTAAVARLSALASRLEAETGGAQGFELPPPETTLMGQAGEFFRGIPAGAVNMLESAAVGASSILPESLEAPAREGIASLAKSMKPGVKYGYEDSGARTFGEALGSMAPFFATAGLSAPVAIASGVGLGTAAGAGEARQRAEMEGATESERAQATALGMIPGALEMLAPFRVVERVLGKELTGTILNRVARAAAAGGEEGAQEAATAVAQNLIERGIYNPEQGVMESTLGEGALGGGAGALAQVLFDMALGRKAKPAPTPPPAEEKPAKKPPEDQYDLLGDLPQEPTPEAPQGQLFGAPPKDGKAPDKAVPVNENEWRAKLGLPLSDDADPRPITPERVDELIAEAAQMMSSTSETPKEVPKFRTRGEAAADAVAAAKRQQAIAQGTAEQPDMFPNAPVPKKQPEQKSETAFTKEELIAGGIPATAPVIRRIAGKDLSVPEIKAAVVADIQQYANKYAPAEVKDKVLRLLQSPLLRAEQAPQGVQTDMLPKHEEGRDTTSLDRDEGVDTLVPSPEVPLPGIDTTATSNQEELTSPLPEYQGVDTTLTSKDEMFAPDAGADATATSEPDTETKPAKLPVLDREDGVVSDVAKNAPKKRSMSYQDVQDISESVDRATQLKPARLPVVDRADGVISDMGPVPGYETTGTSEQDTDTKPAPGTAERADGVISDVAENVPPKEQLTAEELADIVELANLEKVAAKDIATAVKQKRKEKPNAKAATTEKTDAPKTKKPGKQAPQTAKAESESTVEPDELASRRLEKEAARLRKALPEDPRVYDESQEIVDALEMNFNVDMSEGERNTLLARLRKADSSQRPKIAYDYMGAHVRSLDAKSGRKLTDDDAVEAAVLANDPQLLIDAMEQELDADLTETAVDELLTKLRNTERGNWVDIATEYMQKHIQAEESRKGRVAKPRKRRRDDPGKIYSKEEIEAYEKQNATKDSVPEEEVDTDEDPDANVEIDKESQTRRADRAKDQKVIDALPEKHFARKYFEKGASVSDGFKNIAGATLKESEPTRIWVENNLSRSGVADMRRQVARANVDFRMFLPEAQVNEIEALMTPVTGDVTLKLQQGDLVGALRALGKSTNKRVANAAQRLANVMGTTAVELQEDLKNRDGQPSAGDFDPATNTITLNPKRLNAHTLLHEAAHAVTSHTIANKSHPVTKQLEKLFNSVRDKLGTAYGGQSLDEFVAEAFSNEAFRAKLNSLKPDGAEITAWERFLHAIDTLLRKVFGMGPRGTALTSADYLIDQIISPAPGYRAAEKLYAATVTNRGEDWVYKHIYQNLTGKLRMSPEMSTTISEAVRKMSKATYGTLLRSVSLNSVDMITEGRIPQIQQLHDLLRQANGKVERMTESIRGVEKQLSELVLNNTALMADVNKLINDSTVKEVDPRWKQSDVDEDKLDTYHKLKKRYDALPKDGKTAYDMVFAGNDKLRDLAIQIRDGRIDDALKAAGLEQGAAVKIKNRLVRQLMDRFEIRPYAKLARTGKYWAEWVEKDGELGRTSFETLDQRVEAMKKLEADGAKNVRPITKLSEAMRSNAPPSSFVYQLLSELKDAGVPGEVKVGDKTVSITDTVLDAFLDYQPELAMTGSMRRRERTLGYRSDAVNVFLDNSRKVGAELLQMETRNKLTDIERSLPERLNQEAIDEITPAVLQSWGVPTTSPNYNKLKGKKLDSVAARREVRALLQKEIAAGDDATKIRLQPIIDSNNLQDEPIDSERDAEAIAVVKEYIQFARDPRLSGWAGLLRQLGFTFNLGANVSSVIVNATGPAAVSAPLLAGKYGWSNTRKAFNKAYKIYGNTGLKGKIKSLVQDANGKDVEVEILNGWSLRNVDFSNEADLKKRFPQFANTPEGLQQLKDMKVLVDVAEGLGEMSHHLTMDAFDDSTSSFEKRGLWDRINHWSGMLFHHGERMNRHVTMMMAYMLEVDKLRAAGGKPTKEQLVQAARQAVDFMEFTNTSALRTTGPRLAQSSVGSILFMFKRYGSAMLAMQYKLLRDWLGNSNLSKEERQIAKGQFINLMATSGLMAGVQGMPLIGTVMMLADMFLLDDEDPDARSLLEMSIGSGLTNGLLNEVTGLSVAERIGLSNLIIRSQPNVEQDSFVLRLLEDFGGPVFGVASRVEDGIALMGDGEYRRGVERMLPSAIGNVFKSVRYGGEGATTLRGDPITEDINGFNVLAQLLGFAPDDYIQTLEQNALRKRLDTKLRDRVSRARNKLYYAMRNADTDAMQDAMEEIDKINKKYPGAITAESIESSLREHTRVTNEMVNGIYLSKFGKQAFKEYLPEIGE